LSVCPALFCRVERLAACPAASLGTAQTQSAPGEGGREEKEEWVANCEKWRGRMERREDRRKLVTASNLELYTGF
jgi:hypothetical protein